VKDDLRRAYATLGLTPAASPSQVRRAYRQLVKQWHPDRFARDPAGEAEATQRMRAINAAYDTIRGTYIATYDSTPAADGRVRPQATPGARLSREQIDEMVNSIGSEGPVDVVLGVLEWYGNRIRLGITLLLGAWAVARIVSTVRAYGLPGLARYPEVPLFLVAVVAFAAWALPDRGGKET
jgi:curved DNA-binding protein CbpA